MRHCTSCHGGVKQAGDVSFVDPSHVLPPDGWIIEPGDATASLLMERITTDDPDLRMPPPDEHPDPVSESDVELIRRWIDEGADWDAMWGIAALDESLPRPASSNIENVNRQDKQQWARRPLDRFVHQAITAQGWAPSPDANPAQWLRRASLDLTGLPPLPHQLQHFESAISRADSGAEIELAFEREVDRLLSDDHFGERWASLWMDLARYADSMGFEKDPHRDMWPYRNWLINAFNDDMPYDQFTIRQLAGDLLPN
ncbi:MAG: DUF1549 domain-containing protein, partial [Planctomycetota bacterium]